MEAQWSLLLLLVNYDTVADYDDDELEGDESPPLVPLRISLSSRRPRREHFPDTTALPHTATLLTLT